MSGGRIDRYRTWLGLLAVTVVAALGCSKEGPSQPPPVAPRGDGGTLAWIAGETFTGFADGVGREARSQGFNGGALLPGGRAVLLADTFNAVLRRLDLETRALETVAGKVQVSASLDGVGLSARLEGPRSMRLAPDGSAAYFADGPTIRRYALADGRVTTVAGTAGERGYVDGEGPAVRLGYLLHALEFSEDGATLYVADRSNRCLRALELATGRVETVAGAPYAGPERAVDGVGPAARFGGVGGIARIGGALFVADTFVHVIRRVDLATRAVTTVAGVAGREGLVDGPPGTGLFSMPQSLVAHGGALWSTSFDGVLRRIDPDTLAVTTLVGDAADVRAQDGARDVARLGIGFAQPIEGRTAGELLYQDGDANSLRRIDLSTGAVETLAGPAGTQVGRDGALGEARFAYPAGLAATSDGREWFVADALAHVVRRVSLATGRVETIAGREGAPGADDGRPGRLDYPWGLALDEAGRVLYLTELSGRVRRVDLAAGDVSTLAGGTDGEAPRDGAGAQARFASPAAVALDAKGGRLFVADVLPSEGYAALRAVSVADGRVETLVGPEVRVADGAVAGAGVETPAGLAWDPAGERLFFVEEEASIVRVLDVRAGEVRTVAGRAGETGPADGAFAEARFLMPSGAAYSRGEDALYVTDGGNGSVRRLALGDAAVTTWLGDPSLQGNVAGSVPLSTATLFMPHDPVIAAGALGLLAEGALLVARPDAPVLP